MGSNISSFYRSPQINVPKVTGMPDVPTFDVGNDLSGFYDSGVSATGGEAVEGTGVMGLLGKLLGLGKADTNAKGEGISSPLITAGKLLLDGFSTYNNFKQQGLLEDQLDSQKDAFNRQFENQSKLTNASLNDRQRARVASNPTAYQSVGNYMKEFGV